MWVNGVQQIERNVQTLKLLDSLRHERKLVNGIRSLGFSGPETVQLLSHTNISNSKIENEVPRFDWRDSIEGGKVIIWLNDLEKDKRYEGWPESINAVSSGSEGCFRRMNANLSSSYNEHTLGNFHKCAESVLMLWFRLTLLKRMM
jgi:hypothetical protein